ncbi:hypothetical protein OTU49_016697 [Cherax quadricarinatus]|uniref:Protein CASC3 n=2 Tax=Cherax quadricarinatus TaxID=27406 RepID=A0AAW0YSA3_CHEQU|nr:protein CASC3-like isoform X1 [Cherax quadricarinatus]
MADRRRRRKLTSGEDSDESEDDPTAPRKSLIGSDGGESEYESADEEELGEEEEEEDDELIIMPDGIGLGEDNKQLDDDEDRKNPQYIPKKGTFYEHDDRTAAEDDVEKPVEEPIVKKETGKKKVWKEDDKWNHDKFNEFDQAPKSREELVAVYGYDIRNEEGPPRARRRRRYGRGPNKYTRNWEDLDAYAKPVRGAIRGGPGRGGSRSLTGSRKTLDNDEEFPALNSSQYKKHEDDKYIEECSKFESHSPREEPLGTIMDNLHAGENENYKQQPVAPLASQQQQQSPPPQHQHQQQQQLQKNAGPSPQPQDVRADGYGGRGRGSRGRGRGSARGHNREREQYRYNEERGSHNYQDNRSSGRGNRGGHQQRLPQQHNSHASRDVEEITAELKNISVNSQNREEPFRNKSRGGGGNVDNRRSSVPPRLQESVAAAANMQGRGNRGGNASPGGDGSSSRPKRYSSQRQRSIPEQQVPPFPQQHGYMDPAVDTNYQGGVNDGGIVTSPGHTVTAPHTQHPLAGGAPPSFVPPAFTTSPPTFPPEPFLGRPPAPRLFPPVTQSPHIFGPPVAPPPVPGPPVGGPPPVAGPLGAPPVGAPPVPGPPVTGPPFLPPENMINYGAHPGPHPGSLPGAAPHPPQFPPFQGYTPGPVSQPGEIYSNGVTYYNTESQQHLPRSIPPLQKRPKAAIPIVPPPEREDKKGVCVAQDETSAPVGLESGSQDQEHFSCPSNGEISLQNDQKDEQNEPRVSICQSQPETLEQACKEVLQKDLASCDTHIQYDINRETSSDVVSVQVDSSESNIKSSKELSSQPQPFESLPSEQNLESNKVLTSGQVSETPDTAVAAS